MTARDGPAGYQNPERSIMPVPPVRRDRTHDHYFACTGIREIDGRFAWCEWFSYDAAKVVKHEKRYGHTIRCVALEQGQALPEERIASR